MSSPDMLGTIRQLDQQLALNIRSLPSRPILKQLLGKYGTFIKLKDQLDSWSKWLGGAPVVACDGSRLEYGPFYPYTILLQRAMAIASNSNETVIEVDCISPLLADTATEIEKLARQNAVTPSDIYPRWIQKKLAALEVKTAIKALKIWEPRLLLMDGGLLLFDTIPEWSELTTLAQTIGTLVVGVIEEVATAELAPLIGFTEYRFYDRELLFGLLEPGEALVVAPDNPLKKEYRTVFTRFSSRPAATACDFLPGTRDDDIIHCLNLLYATTGPTGRGIPLLIDQVDRKVRLTRQEGETWLKIGLSAATYEKYFVSQRANRNI